jgi:hypothetical protein
MRTTQNKTPWESHDWKVKILESLGPGGGSKLAYTCRACERKFTQTTANNAHGRPAPTARRWLMRLARDG